ncbi:hypothetical protein [uncultured Flavobacterium sp.]|uniref:hypothetical protein n=1 Tax=uncultured Flavobacterium sp. TaxID=165435 RepID=UPI0030ECA5E3|tara:strand:+ start:21133 stop:21522 length:390 start_codon:yes stop_codon:yes gene_type:complete
MKKVLIIVSAIALFFLLVGFGFYGFSKMIYNSCSCEQFNIDNIELRTGINIPKIKSVDCTYDESTKTKKATFIIDLEKVDIEDYIQQNKLVQSDADELYIKSYDAKNHSYKGTLNKITGKLDIEIIYKD